MPAAALAALLAVPAPAPAPRLPERFAAAVALSSAATAAERALYDQAVPLVLGTPTGRALAERLLERDRRVSVAFADLEGIYGLADAADPALARVTVSRGHLSWRAELAGLVLAETLAHEVLGHVLHQREAEEAGVGYEYNSCVLDELGARAVGWTVSYEAGWPYPNASAEALAADADRYAAGSVLDSPRYSDALTRAELADPVAAYRARLAVPGEDARRAGWTARLAQLESRPDMTAGFARAARDPFFDRLEAELTARRARLGELQKEAVRRMTPEAALPVLVCGWAPAL